MKKIKPFKERNSSSLLSSQYTVYREWKDNKIQLNWASGKAVIQFVFLF
ncbi:hypothetical protein M115_1819 [Bacteroides fragilis str. 3719 T6]|nr:hypothetical protein M115_1819 [Bacteroides fragilis str. 3719 T6]